jgi:hypothetical protein
MGGKRSRNFVTILRLAGDGDSGRGQDRRMSWA